MEKMQWIQNKICTAETLVRRCNGARAMGKRIVFTNGCFDILHHGHLSYLAKAADLGSMLVIGINTDASVRRLKGSGRPVNREADRALQLASLLVTDAVCLFDEDTPETLIHIVRPDVLVKGGDYTPEQVAGGDFVTASGGEVMILPFVDGYSTTSLLERMKGL